MFCSWAMCSWAGNFVCKQILWEDKSMFFLTPTDVLCRLANSQILGYWSTYSPVKASLSLPRFLSLFPSLSLILSCWQTVIERGRYKIQLPFSCFSEQLYEKVFICVRIYIYINFIYLFIVSSFTDWIPRPSSLAKWPGQLKDDWNMPIGIVSIVSCENYIQGSNFSEYSSQNNNWMFCGN